MHIVIDARFINSGTGTYVRELLNHLQEIDKKNRYSVLIPTKDLSYWTPSQPHFSLVACDYAYYSLAEQLHFLMFLNSLKADLVHFAMPQQPVFYRGLHVTTMHDITLLNTYNSDKNWLIFHLKQLVGRWVWKRIAQTNHHIIAISNNTKHEYQAFSHIPERKISVIYEAAEAYPTTLTPYHELPFKEFIMYVGQQPDYKNIRRLGDAHQELLKTHPSIGLVLVGRKQKDTLRKEAYFTSKGYRNIHFTGFLPDDQRDWLYSKAIAYVFPSLMEGFGLPPLEAMAYGTPVVSSNASCMPEILGDAAMYFDPRDTMSIRDTIERIVIDNNLRQRLRERGYNQAAKYSWRRMAEETYDVYMKALASKPS